MATYARAIGGSVSGLVALAGTSGFNLKTERWAMRGRQDVHDVSGFGDGGNTYWSPGKNVWRGSLGGYILTGTSNINISNLTGTNSLMVSGVFTADNGVVFTGSARCQDISMDVNYKRGGFCPITLNFVIEGELVES